MEIYNTIGSKDYKNLLADPKGARKITVPVTPNSAIIPIGTLLVRGDTGLYAAAKAADIVSTKNLVVLGEELAVNEGTVAENAAVYESGRFIDGAVYVGESNELTAAQKIVLRQFGIVFDVDSTAGTFENDTATGSSGGSGSGD